MIFSLVSEVIFSLVSEVVYCDIFTGVRLVISLQYNFPVVSIEIDYFLYSHYCKKLCFFYINPCDTHSTRPSAPAAMVTTSRRLSVCLLLASPDTPSSPSSPLPSSSSLLLPTSPTQIRVSLLSLQHSLTTPVLPFLLPCMYVLNSLICSPWPWGRT